MSGCHPDILSFRASERNRVRSPQRVSRYSLSTVSRSLEVAADRPRAMPECHSHRHRFSGILRRMPRRRREETRFSHRSDPERPISRPCRFPRAALRPTREGFRLVIRRMGRSNGWAKWSGHSNGRRKKRRERTNVTASCISFPILIEGFPPLPLLSPLFNKLSGVIEKERHAAGI